MIIRTSALALTCLWLPAEVTVADAESAEEIAAASLAAAEDGTWAEWPPPLSMGNCDPKFVQDQGKDPAEVLFDFDCVEYPSLCKNPLNCHTLRCDYIQKMSNPRQPFCPNGKSDPQLFCFGDAKRYGEYILKCVGDERDVLAAGKIQYEHTHALRHGPYTPEMDASFCYGLALCDLDEITPSTTLEEAGKVCDKVFGNDKWTQMRYVDFVDAMGNHDPQNGFVNQSNAVLWGMFGCAMGNFHCDVVMCQETYCKNEKYSKKYGHLLEKARANGRLWARSEEL